MEEDRLDGEAILARWELAGDEVEAALTRRLAIGFLGPASSGKDSAIRALFGIDFGDIDPIPGSTERVRAAELDADGRVLVVNAPGFGDIRAEVDQAARDLVERLDIVLYLVNADGGATIDERRDIEVLRRLGRPLLICLNKIDLIRPHQRDGFVEATLGQLGVPSEDARVTAFDPLPALSAEPIGLRAVITWVHDQLEDQGKALLFAKQLRNKAAACEPLIRSAARRAALAGALPVPGADLSAVTAIQVRLISEVAAIHGQRIDRDVLLFLVGQVIAGTGRGFVKWAVQALKAAGWMPGGQAAHLAAGALAATVAGATTYGVGRAALAFVQHEKRLSPEELQEVFDREAFRWRDEVR